MRFSPLFLNVYKHRDVCSSFDSGSDVQLWNKNPLIRKNLSPWAPGPLGVQEYPFKKGVTPLLMAAVVRSLSSYKHLSQWWKCLGREKWYTLADLHGRNPSERRAALLRSATGINDPQAMCAHVSRQRQWLSIVMHSRYSKKTQPCYKVPLHEGQHCTKDCEEILKTLKSPTKRRFGCCWQSQGVLIVRHGTKKCLWRGFDSSLKVSILKINKSGYANCAFQVWDNKGCHRCFETEHKEEKVMFSWRWWDNMIYILFAEQTVTVL